jgi:hypothetical protein
MRRFGGVERVREQWLAGLGLLLALLALALAAVPAHGDPAVSVLALRRAIPAGGIVRSGDVVAVPIAASDRTPSMLAGLGGLAGRRTSIALAGGDFLVRGALRGGDRSRRLRRGERALALQLSSAAVPDPSLLRAGRTVDVVVVDRDGPHIAARGLELLSPASERSGGVVVTLRAPTALALSLANAQAGRDLRLLLRGDGT